MGWQSSKSNLRVVIVDVQYPFKGELDVLAKRLESEQRALAKANEIPFPIRGRAGSKSVMDHWLKRLVSLIELYRCACMDAAAGGYDVGAEIPAVRMATFLAEHRTKETQIYSRQPHRA